MTRIICAGCLLIAVLSAVFAQASGPRVEMSLIVTDKDKKAVKSVRKEDVHVFEDKVEQTVLSVEPDERPIDFALVIDTTGSMRSQLPVVVQAARLMIINGRPSDQFFIERFVSSDKIQMLQDFTSDAVTLTWALSQLRVEGGISAVLDGVYVGSAYLAKHNKSSTERRKVLILISDGEDRSSRTKLDEVVKQLRTEEIQVFAIGLINELDSEGGVIRRSPRERAKKLFAAITEETGGRVFFPQDKDELTDAANRIVADLRSQFRITYQSSNEITQAGYRKVEVKLTSPSGEKRNAIVPRSYYVDSKNAQAKPTEQKSP